MAIFVSKSFSNCFDKVQDACTAIERGEDSKAGAILCSLRADAKSLQSECKKYNRTLQRYGDQKEAEIEEITSKINDLYIHQRNLEREKERLWLEETEYENQRQKEQASLQQAQDRYNQAVCDRIRAQDKYDTFKIFWWVPIVGQILLIRELIEDYSGQARRAANDMSYYRWRIKNAYEEINTLHQKVFQVQNAIQEKNRSITMLKRQRGDLHAKLGSIKEVSVFLLEAAAFWDDIANMSNNASEKTDRLLKIYNFAAKHNNIKILHSNGTRTLMGSFKDCWLEIENMMRDNDFVIFEEDLQLE